MLNVPIQSDGQAVLRRMAPIGPRGHRLYDGWYGLRQGTSGADVIGRGEGGTAPWTEDLHGDTVLSDSFGLETVGRGSNDQRDQVVLCHHSADLSGLDDQYRVMLLENVEYCLDVHLGGYRWK